MTLHGLMDSMYVKELANRTHRGLESRALQGMHTGRLLRVPAWIKRRHKTSTSYETWNYA